MIAERHITNRKLNLLLTAVAVLLEETSANHSPLSRCTEMLRALADKCAAEAQKP